MAVQPPCGCPDFLLGVPPPQQVRGGNQIGVALQPHLSSAEGGHTTPYLFIHLFFIGQWLRCFVDLDGCDALLTEAHEADSGKI